MMDVDRETLCSFEACPCDGCLCLSFTASRILSMPICDYCVPLKNATYYWQLQLFVRTIDLRLKPSNERFPRICLK
jgi:hypothetical protein